ncbi:hypothetical protein GCM10020220_095400 [Nonomuraea rubra]
MGASPSCALAADLEPDHHHAVQAGIETDAPVTRGRVRVRSAEGDTRHWSLSFSPSTDDAGERRSRSRLVGLDVTERRQPSEALRRSESAYRSLVEAQSQLV